MLRMRDRVNRSRQRIAPRDNRCFIPTLNGDRRWVVREAVQTGADLRERGRPRFSVQVINLSTHGCAVKSRLMVATGSRSWITLPTLQSWYASVVWRRGDVMGLEFEEPMHRAVTEMIVQRTEPLYRFQALRAVSQSATDADCRTT